MAPRLWDLVPWALAAAVLLGSAVGVAVMGAREGEGAVAARSDVTLHEVSVAWPASGVQDALTAEPGSPVRGGPPLLIDAALVEASAVGGLPRIAADGRRPAEMFRRRAPAGDRPKIAVLILEIGLDRAASATAAALPAAFTLVASPYGSRPWSWHRRGRWLGHEMLLELPVRPRRFPLDDAGPLSLYPGAVTPAAIGAILERGIGYVGVAVEAGQFAAEPMAFRPVAEELAKRGLSMVELGSRVLESIASASGLPTVTAEGPLDLEPSADAIDAALAALETSARSMRRAVGFVRPLPITMERLSAWSRVLPEKGIELVGIGSILEERAAISAENR